MISRPTNRATTKEIKFNRRILILVSIAGVALLLLIVGVIATTTTTSTNSIGYSPPSPLSSSLSSSADSLSKTTTPTTVHCRATSSSLSSSSSSSSSSFGAAADADAANNNNDNSLLIIATVPQTKLHLQSLWSMLQCMSVGYNHVVVSAPLAARTVIQQTQRLAIHHQIHPNLDFVFVRDNNRYDVGLWCEALDYANSNGINNDDNNKYNNNNNNKYKYITLVNDSIMVLRHSRVVLDKLETHRYDLVGMSYSHTGGSFWIESYIRGFSRRGIDIFQRHSCTKAPSHESFATKRAVVDYHEIGMVNTYFSEYREPGKLLATGLYPGDLPQGWIGRGDANKTWVSSVNLPYWKRGLLKAHLFPIAKLKMPQMISWSTKHYHDCKMTQIPKGLEYVDPDEQTWSWKQVFETTTVNQ